MSNLKTLLCIEPYRFTGEQIGKLREQYENKDYFEEHILPTFCLRKDNGHLVTSYHHLYWIDSGEEEYILFFAYTDDKLLSEEISNSGLESLLKGFDLRPILENFRIYPFEHFKRNVPTGQYIIVELIYSSYYCDGGYEYDMDVDVIGYLNGNLEPVYVKL